MARAQLGMIVRDMLELQRKQGSAAMDEQYLDAAIALHQRYQEWMDSLDFGLQSCELVSQQHIMLQ